MDFSKTDSVLIPADKIEEKDMTVIITYQGKRTIIHHATVLPDSKTNNVVYAKIRETKLGTIVEPIYSDRQEVIQEVFLLKAINPETLTFTVSLLKK